MILTDFSQISIAAILAVYYGEDQLAEINEAFIRHVILNSLKKINNQFRNDFGQHVLAMDGNNYWRKQFFPFYKIKRRKDKEDSDLDWNFIQSTIEKIGQEIKDNLNFLVVQVNEAEADDVIATLALLPEKSIVISRDSDFKQLLKHKNIIQYDPIGEKFLELDDVRKFLFEKICKGDSSDSIPNVVSPANSIAIGERQKPMTQKKMDLWQVEGIPDEIVERFKFNQELIDFDHIPDNIKDAIMLEYTMELNTSYRNSMKIMNYFMRNNLNNILSDLSDFV